MLRRTLLALLLFITLGTLSAPLSAQLHKDERLGFSIKAPKKWTQIPLSKGEQWICARFKSNKTDSWVDDTIGYSRSHTPSLRVVGFVDKFIKGGERAGEDDEEDKEEGSEVTTSGFVFNEIYQNYDEFLKKNFDDGYYVSKESEEMVGDFKVRKLEMRVEESGKNGHRLILTWIYPTDIGKIAIEFEVLEDSYRKNKSNIDKTFKSFKVIPRTKKLEPTSNLSEFVSQLVLREMSPVERSIRKRELRDQAWEKTKANQIEGWTPMEFGEIRIITRHDKKHAKSVANSMLAILDWLDESFPTIGPEEFVRLPTVRICKDYQEKRSYLEDRSYSFVLTEIVTQKDSRGISGSEWDFINRTAKNVWFRERDRELDSAMPDWLDVGLTFVVNPARVKGKKIKFNRNWWELGFKDDSEPWDLEKVMTMDRSRINIRSNGKPSRGLVQAVALVRFLVDGPGSKGKFKGFLADYLKNVGYVVAELDKKSGEDSKKEIKVPKTEEEEDAALKKRRELLQSRRQEIMEKAYRRTAKGMKASTLEALNKAYLKEVK